MKRVVPIQKDIVLIGGGHAHVAVLKRFGMRPIPGVRLTLITPTFDTPYSGMLPGFLAGHYTFAESHLNLLPLCQFAGAQCYRDTVVGLDLKQKRIHCAQHPPVSFDWVSIDTGSTPAMSDVPGAREHAIPVKPVDSFLRRWETIEANLKASPERTHQFLTVGAGAGGVELTLSLQHRLQQHGLKARFAILTRSSSILPSHNTGVQTRYQRLLEARGIPVHTNQEITRVTESSVQTKQTQSHDFDSLFWLTHAAAPAWPAESGLAVDEHGFIQVNPYLQSPSHPFVFAAGDVASMIGQPRPKSGVFAVRQGPPLADNLANAIYQRPLRRYRPQSRFLSLISTGDAYAVASRGGWSTEGRWVWRWKDGIDRRWMRQYQELPKMAETPTKSRPKPQPPLPDTISAPAIRCTGCGSKVGHQILHRVLKRLDITDAPSIAVGLEAPDDAAVFSLPSDASIVQTVDFFPAFLNDPWLFAQIATLHCLGDILAMGAQPHSAQAVVTIPYGEDRPTEEILYQTLAGALKTLQAHGTPLIGGHTLEGDQLAFGLTVNGTGDPKTLFRKGGLRSGDHLVLTKPLGTGVLLASLMRGIGPSQWLANAIDHMLNSNQSAVPILRANDATAATDLTGFGFMGHLLEMLEASSLDARIQANAIPVLDGTRECAQADIRSSLFPQNHRNQAAITNAKAYTDHPDYATWFDPQTAGGLLFGVAPERSAACVEALQRAGYPASQVVGQVEGRDEPDRSAITLVG